MRKNSSAQLNHEPPNASGTVDCYDAQKGGAPVLKVEPNLFGGYDLRQSDGKLVRCEKKASGERLSVGSCRRDENAEHQPLGLCNAALRRKGGRQPSGSCRDQSASGRSACWLRATGAGPRSATPPAQLACYTAALRRLTPSRRFAMPVVSLAQLQGKVLESARFDGETEEWIFQFPSKTCLQVSAPWRLLVEGRIRLGWRDHGHRFGLPKPVDASERLPIGSSVTEASIVDGTGDLSVVFAGGAVLEVFNDSCGYEGWTLNGPGAGSYVVAQGGGTIVRSGD